MGVCLWIQRSDGRREDLNAPTYEEAMSLFDAIPWKEDVAHFRSLADAPDDPLEEHRPIFGLLDDSGRMLRIMAYSEKYAGCTFNYFHGIQHFGVEDFERDNAWKSTDRIPRSEMSTVVRFFFDGNYEAIFGMFEKYPISVEEKASAEKQKG
jgi:hypothetical protein